MGDDVQMAEQGSGTHEILPVYQPNTKSAFNAYKVRLYPRLLQIAVGWMDRRTGGFRFFFIDRCLAMVDAAWILIGDVAKRLRAIDTINDIFMSALWRYFSVWGGSFICGTSRAGN